MKRMFFLIVCFFLLNGLIIGAVFSCGDGGAKEDGRTGEKEADDDDSSGGTDDASDDDNDGNDDTAIDDDGADDDDNTSGETWTDSSSGLTWQVNWPCEYLTWEDAKSYCENLVWDGGGWHLPTISELRTLIRGCEATMPGGPCGVTDSCLELSCFNDACFECDNGQGPNSGCFGPVELPGECDWYWSSSPVTDSDGKAWFVLFYSGGIFDVANTTCARCVR